MNRIAEENKTKFPEASSIILNSFYMDDLCFGTNSIEKWLRIRDQIRTMLSEAGMKLCKLIANDKKLLTGIPFDEIECNK